jgi:anti-sigma factor RsiW
MGPTEEDDVHGLTGAYALDALDTGERRVFEEHLAACPSCTVEVEQLREAIARLGAAQEVTPRA